MAGFHESCIVVICLVVLTQLVTSQDHLNFVTVGRFTLYRNPMFGIERGPVSSEISLSVCAVKCQDLFQSNCNAFLYNEQTKRCTPGTFLRMDHSAPSLVDGDLYISDTSSECDIQSGFELLSLPNNSNHYCVHLTQDKLPWVDAKARCESLGAYLAYFDSLQEVTLMESWFKQKIGTAYYWVGLSDRETEGTFVWVKDGSVLTSAKTTELFKEGNPDNWQNEDCVQIQGDYLNDDKCDTNRFTICQKTVLPPG